MKAVIFAGGVGTRLWPLSRRNSPKQFEKVIGDKSTIQLAVERLLPNFEWKDIYIATNQNYKSIVLEQLPSIIPANIICEPETRDVGPAVGLVTATLYNRFPHEPIVILWSDHIIKKVELFKKILSSCEKIVKENHNKIIFIAQKPRFASQNLGWIRYNKQLINNKNIKLFTFESFYYRPSIAQAEKFYQSNHYAWNLGYFVSTPSFLWSLFQRHQPEMFNILKVISRKINTPTYHLELKKLYAGLAKISFDNAILEKLNRDDAYVIADDLGWSDVGAWEALKEALQNTPEQNVIKGKVLVTDCSDTLVYNYTDQLVVTIDLQGFIVINTNDVMLVCHKNSVPKIKKLVEKLADSDNEHLL